MNVTKEQIDLVVPLIKKYWQIGLIFFISVIAIFMYQRNEANKKELIEYRAKQELTQSIADIESRLNAMRQREAEYIEMEKKYALLNDIDKQLSKKRKELNEVKKESINAQVQKMSNADLNAYLNQSGYSSSIVSK